ncbi:unnamed protein product [Symbiodinium natans]|uniref:Uncharacterized protein n=1 Tax=Symbiodinium natans TaxID=878477 RepID=A0A812MUP1_9DINO|nr:unnamed protein product [Symbiodinium natans]
MGLRKSKPVQPAEPEEPSLLEQSLGEVAFLLGQQQLAEAGDAFLRSLKVLEEQKEISGKELAALSTVLPAAFTALAWESPPLGRPAVQLAFGASALVARVATLARDQPEALQSTVLDLLQLCGAYMSSAWYPGSPLAYQTIDNNRYVLLLGEIMSQVLELPLEHRQVWGELAARCSTSDLWTSQFFLQQLQSLMTVWPLLSVPTATMLSGALLASCEDTSRFAAGNQLLERVLRFQQAWPKDAQGWEWQRPALVLLASGRPMAPAHSLATFFLARLPASTALSTAVTALSACLARDSGFYAQCAFTAFTGAQGPVPSLEIVSGLCETLCLELLPVHFLDMSVADLERERRTALRQVLVPRFCLAIGRCAAALPEEAQVARLAEHLEHWAMAVSLHAASGSSQPARRWFTFSVFFALSTIAREADIQQLAPRVLLKLLRAMSCVDMLREDSQEYRAMCLSIVESGCAREEGFRLELLSTLRELEANAVSARESSGAPLLAASSRLHFWLGMLANEVVIKHPMFTTIWPALVRMARAGDAVASRSVALAAMTFTQGGRGQRDGADVEAILEAGLDGFAAAEGEAMLKPLHVLVEAVTSQDLDFSKSIID